MSRSLFLSALAVATVALSATSAFAGPVTVYQGTDLSVAFGSPIPNSDAAAAAFNAALAGMAQPVTKIDFESTPPGAIGAPTAIGAGVTLGVTNTPNSSITNTQNVFGMFNTTPGGSNYFGFVTQFVAQGATTTATATFAFASPIDAFGATFTGLGTDTIFTIDFFDGSSQTISGLGSALGSDAAFYGFIDPGSAIASVTLTDTWTSPFPNFAYFVGVDDVQFATPTPEPASMLLLGSGLMTLAVRRRRSKGSPARSER